MIRISILLIVIMLPAAGGLLAQPVGSSYGFHLRPTEVQEIELAPGIVVSADMWSDDHVVTIADLVAVGMSFKDASDLVEPPANEPGTPAVPCSWGQMKWCFLNNIPMDRCCGKMKENG